MTNDRLMRLINYISYVSTEYCEYDDFEPVTAKEIMKENPLVKVTREELAELSSKGYISKNLKKILVEQKGWNLLAKAVEK